MILVFTSQTDTLSLPPQRGRPHTLRDTLRDTSHLALGYTGDPLRQKLRILSFPGEPVVSLNCRDELG
jgi:hypothetical protein